ncbi:unnamed protein product [Brassica oleracea]
MSSATVLDESSVSSPRSTWRMDGQLRYDIAMNTIIIILITDAVLHMTLRAHKIPLDDNVVGLLCTLVVPYMVVITINCGYWLTETEDEGLGFCILLCLLYSISHLAMYVALPCLLWLVPAMFAPCCPCLWRGESAWWNFVKQPQPRVDIVLLLHYYY